MMGCAGPPVQPISVTHPWTGHMPLPSSFTLCNFIATWRTMMKERDGQRHGRAGSVAFIHPSSPAGPFSLSHLSGWVPSLWGTTR